MRSKKEPFQVRQLDDCWWAVAVPGVGHVIDVLLEPVNGRPEVVGLRVRPASWVNYFAGEPLPYDPDTETAGDVPAKKFWDWERRQKAEFLETQEHPVITVEVLRALPLGRIRDSVLEVSSSVEFLFRGKAPSKLDAGGGLSDQFLQRIAEMYEGLRSAGNRHPLVTIAEREHVSRATANKWVGRARDRGLLPPFGRKPVSQKDLQVDTGDDKVP